VERNNKPTSLTFRPFRHSDYDQLVELAQVSADRDSVQWDGSDFYHLRYGDPEFFRDGEFQPERDVWIAAEGRRVVGVCGALGYTSLVSHGVVELWGPLIHPNHRKQGLGKMMTTMAIHSARRFAGCTLQKWLPSTWDSIGISLVGKFGFYRRRCKREMVRHLPWRPRTRPRSTGTRIHVVSKTKDFEEATALHKELQASYPNGGTMDLTPDRLKSMARDPLWRTEVLLARFAGRPAGIAFCQLASGSIEGYISDLGVLQQYRRQNIGKLLLAEALDRLGIQGAKSVMVDIDLDNAVGYQLAKHFRFRPERDVFLYERPIKQDAD